MLALREYERKVPIWILDWMGAYQMDTLKGKEKKKMKKKT